MSIEFLERKKKAIEGVTQAYRTFQAALRAALDELPEEWREEILDDIGRLADSNGKPDYRTNLPTAANAVREILSKHPAGLPAKEIITTLTGKIKTRSDNQYKLLYSTLAVLKRNGKIVQDTDGRYRLPSRHKAE